MNAVYTNEKFRWANRLNWLKDLLKIITEAVPVMKLVRGNGTISLLTES